MAEPSARKLITDDLLAIAVRIKRDAGVSHSVIQAIIDRFASQEHFEERTGGIGFPLVEDIPQPQRSDFLAALSDLTPSPEEQAKLPRRVISAAKIWPHRVFRD